MSDLSGVVPGTRLRVTTTYTTVEGLFYSFAPETGTVILQETTNFDGSDKFRMLQEAFVSDVQVLAPPADDYTSPITSVNMEAAQRREEASVKKIVAQMQKIGVGVTEEAQTLFDQLSKTLPCAWKGDTIVVMDTVFVKQPYTPENVQSDDKRALAHIRKVVTGARKRLGLK